MLKLKNSSIMLSQTELEPIRKRREEYQKDIAYVYDVLKKGSEKAEQVAANTLTDVKNSMKINYFEDSELIAEQIKKYGEQK